MHEVGAGGQCPAVAERVAVERPHAVVDIAVAPDIETADAAVV